MVYSSGKPQAVKSCLRNEVIIMSDYEILMVVLTILMILVAVIETKR